MGFIGSIQGTLMQGNGVMGRAMVWEFRLAPMVAVISESSSTASSTVSDVTILGEFLPISLEFGFMRETEMRSFRPQFFIVYERFLILLLLSGHFLPA